MKTTSRLQGLMSHRRRAFVLLAVAAVALQLVILLWLTRAYRTPVWGTMRVMGWLHTVLVCVADALLLSLPAMSIHRHWRWLQWLLLSLFTAWGVAQLMYFPTYFDLMPPSSFVLWQNLDAMVLDSALSNWTPRCWLFVVPFVALAAADVLWLSRNGADGEPPRRGWLRVILAVIGLHVAADVVAYTVYWHKSVSVPEYLNDNYTHVKMSHACYLADNGLTGYLAYSAVVELAQHSSLTDDDQKRVTAFLQAMPAYADNTHSAGRDNLIVVIVESLNSWVVNLRLDGREVTPVLNALCADTSSIVGLHMRRQVKNGGSSDGHFMYNTGLLPLEQRAVAMVYPHAHYPTLVEALHRPVNVHICADPPALWNAEATAHTYGYSEFHGGRELKPLLQPSQWQWDKVILEAASRHLSRLRQPFVAQVVTLGMHEPYSRVDVPESWISRSGLYTLKVRNYLERVAVFDRELGLFIDRLRRQGLYDNSLIVVVSDHNDFVDQEPHGRPAIDPDGRDCVLLVLNSGHGRRLEHVFGQIDVYPTLLDLMGANSYAWKGVGNSLLRMPAVSSVAMSPAETCGSGPLLPRQVEAWEVSRLLITSRWFDTHTPGK